MARNTKFETLLRARGANFGEWLGASVVDDFGDVSDEYAAANSAETFGISDRSSRGTVVAIGTEVIPLLQGIVTSDVFALAEPGSGQLSTAVNAKGRLVCDVRLLHGPEVLIMDFEPGLVEDGVISHFRANVMMEDAKFIDRTPSTSVIGMHGPNAGAKLDELALLLSPADDLELYCGTWGTLFDADIIVRRSPLGFDLLLDNSSTAQVWEKLEEAGGKPVGERALEMLRVERGFPRWGAELDQKIIPLEAGLDAISFNKGCYVGQEIIARLDTLGKPAKILRTLELDGAADDDLTVFDGTKKVGEIRTIIDSPALGRPLALAYIKRDHNDIGHTLRVGEVPATIR